MFYFKTNLIDNLHAPIVEKAIRSFSLKRHTSLDFKSSSSYIGEEKYFLGFENKNELMLTRLRTPFERLFPKIIIRFKKDNTFSSYQVRFSMPSFGVFCLLIYALIANILSLIRYGFAIENVLILSVLVSLFIIFTAIEISLTRNRINKAIQKTNENEFLNVSWLPI